MAETAWRERLTNTRRWSRGGARAPHKPLLLLMVLARLQQTGSSTTPFADAEPKLSELLGEFGPPNATSPAYPFHHLRSDGFWTVDTDDERPSTSRAADLRRRHAEGRFDPELEAELLTDPTLVVDVARTLLEEWPSTLHDDIVTACGLDLVASEVELARERAGELADQRRRRDRAFRDRVLVAYEMRCAFCEFDGRLGAQSVGLDAAHVHWWSHGGPDVVDNGMCLCTLHHKLLDLGVLGVTAEHTIEVSHRFVGRGTMAEALVVDLHARPIVEPRRGEPALGQPYLDWHRMQVFRSPARG